MLLPNPSPTFRISASGLTNTHNITLRVSFNTHTQTQTDGASESKTDPEVLAGFDDWNDMPVGVARFLERVGADMEIELDNSDDSQV